MSPFVLTRSHKTNCFLRASLRKLPIFVIGGFFIFFAYSAQAVIGDYNKPVNGTLAASEWNNLINDFVAKSGARLDGYFSINTATSSSYALDINGSLRATNFSGAYTGTLNAGNISAGTFGANTGGGNYNFLGNLGIGIGTSTPNSAITLGNNRWISALNSSGTGYVNMFRVNANDEIEVGGALNIGQFQFPSDSGFNTFVDMPVTNSSASGTVMGYTMKVDGDNILNVYSESNGIGGVQNRRIGIGTSTPRFTLDVAGIINASALYVNGSPYIGSQWTTQGTSIYYNTGNVGVGVTNPSDKLHIEGGGIKFGIVTSGPDSSTGGIALRDNVFGSEDSLTFRADSYQYQTRVGVSLLTLRNSGNVGIGTTSPASTLDVNGLIKMRSATITSNEDVINKGYLDSALSSSSATIITQIATSSIWQGSLTGNVYNANTGNVGVGVTAPAGKLDVAGNIRLSGGTRTIRSSGFGMGIFDEQYSKNILSQNWLSGYNDLLFLGAGGSNNVNNWLSISSGYGFQVGSGGTTTPAGTTHFTINNSGNVGIGMTAPANKLDVLGAIGINGVANSDKILSMATYATVSPGGSRNYLQSGSDGFNIVSDAGSAKINLKTWNGSAIQSNLTVVGTTGNIGIGSTTPGTRLTVVGFGNYSIDAGNYRIGNVAAPVVDNDAVTKSYMDSAINSATSSITLWGGNTSGNIFSLNSGNVGIGTGAPLSPLTVKGTGVAGEGLIGMEGANAHLGFSTSAGVFKGWVGYFNNVTHGNDRDLNIKTGYNGSSNIRFSVAGDSSEAMLINSSGNVGVGTTNPQYGKLTIGNYSSTSAAPLAIQTDGSGTGFTIANSATEYTRFVSGSVTKGLIGYGAVPMSFSNGGSIYFAPQGVETMRLTGGNVGIGTTNPQYLFDVNKGASDAVLHVGSGTYTPTGSLATQAFFFENAGASNLYSIFQTKTAAGIGLNITNAGNLGIGTSTPESKLSVSNGNILINDAVITSATPKVAVTKEYLDSSLTAFNNETNLWKLNGSNLYSSTTNWNIGIGTTDPSSKLHVNGNIRTPNNSKWDFWTFGPTSDGYIQGGSAGFVFNSYNATNGFNFTKGAPGTSLMLINSSGNVGIGTTNPGTRLEVAGTNSTSSPIVRISPGAGLVTDSGVLSVNGRSAFGYDGNRGAVIISDLAASKPLVIDTAGLERVRVEANGNVGIGSINPTKTLEIKSVGRSEYLGINTQDQYSVFTHTETGTDAAAGYGGFSFVSDAVIANNYSSLFKLRNAFITPFVVTNAGNIGIGSTTPETRLTVVGSGNYSIDASNYRIGNVAAPVGGNDAVTKSYMDSAINSATSSITLWGGNTSGNIYSLNSGNVGIGITNPGNKLEVSGGSIDISSAGEGIRFMPTSQDYNIIRGYNAEYETNLAFGTRYPLIFQTVSTGAFEFIDHLGNSLAAIKGTTGQAYFKGSVGIGTTTPQDLLHLYGSNKYLQIQNSNDPANYYFRIGEEWSSGNAFRIYQKTNQLIGANYSGTNIFLMPNSGNVGIGTTEPGTNLVVRKANPGGVGGQLTIENYDPARTAGTYASLNFALDGSTYAGASGNASIDAILQTGGTATDLAFSNYSGSGFLERMRITAAGTVGIGTTTPAAKLSISGGNAFINDAVITSATPKAAITKEYLDSSLTAFNTENNLWRLDGNNLYSSSTNWNVGIGVTAPNIGKLQIKQSVDTSSGGLAITNTGATASGRFYVNTSSLLINSGGTGTNSLVLNEGGGNVGIGTTNPVYKLSLNSLSGADNRINFTETGDVVAGSLVGRFADSKDLRIQNSEAASTIFYTSNAERMRIDSNGNVGIGTTNPWAKMSSYGTVQGGVFDALEVKNEATSAAGNGVRIVLSPQSNYFPADKGGYIEADYDNVTARVKLKLGARTAGDILTLDGNSGNVGVGTTTPGTKLTVIGSGNYSIDAGNYRIGNVAAPVGGNDAVTKSYMDSAINSATSSITLWGGNTSGNIWSLNSGNVGIGTTNPQSLFEVQGPVGTGEGSAGVITLSTKESTVSIGDVLGRINFNAPLEGDGGDSNLVTGSIASIATANFTSTNNGSRLGFFTGNSESATEKVSITGTGSVGIGTTTPGAVLHVLSPNFPVARIERNTPAQGNIYAADYTVRTNVSGLSNGAGVARYFGLSDNTGTLQYAGSFGVKWIDSSAKTMLMSFNTADNGADPTGGTEKMVITGAGNVGIGTTAPSEKLEISNSNKSVIKLTGYTSSVVGIGNAMSEINFADLQGTRAIIDAMGEDGDWHPATSLRFFTSIGHGSPIEKMRIISTGNVGIGTTTPAARLSISGGNAFVNDAVITSATPKAAITKEYLDSSLTAFNQDTNLWKLDGNSLYSSTTTWNVGIGTTTPAHPLTVAGDINVASGQFLGPSVETAYRPSFSFDGDTDTGVSHGGAGVLNLYANGSARVGVSSALTTIYTNARLNGDTDVAKILTAGMFSTGYINVAGNPANPKNAALTIGGGKNAYVNPVGSEVFVDTFDANAGELSTHVPDVGSSWTMLTQNGATAVINSQAAGYMQPTLTLADMGVLYTADVAMPTADYEVSTYIRTSDSSDDVAILAVRIQDTENMYAFRFSSTLSAIYKKVGGVWTLLSSGTLYVSNGTTVKFRVVGNEMAAYRDGTLLVSAVDSDISAAGKPGFGSGKLMVATDDHTTSWSLDDFKVTTYDGEAHSAVFTNNVGIGTTNPTTKLTVVGTGNYSIDAGNYRIGNVAAPVVGNDAVTKSYMDSAINSATSSITLWGGNTSDDIWNLNSGNVGIGTTIPFLGQLHINKGTAAGLGGDLWITNNAVNTTGNSARLSFGLDNTTDVSSNAFIQAVVTNSSGFLTDLIFGTYGTGALAERMRITSSGKVGIGVTNPIEKMQITNGNLYMPASNSNYGAIVGTGSVDNFSSNGVIMPHYGIKWATPTGASGSNLMLSGFYGLRLFTGGNERMTIINSGIGIGTSTPDAQLSVSGGNVFINDWSITASTPKAAITKEYLDSALSAFNQDSNLWKLDGNNLYSSSTNWNVGIGTTAPGAGFVVKNGLAQFFGATVPTSGTGVEVGYDGSSSYGIIKSVNRDTSGLRNLRISGSGVYIYTGTSTSLTETAAFAVDPSGNVGIGTLSPNTRLDINGAFRTNNSATFSMLGGGGNRVTAIDNSGALGGSNIYLNGGNVGIGTTNPNIAKLHIAKDVTNAGLNGYYQFLISGANNPAQIMGFGYDTTNNYGYISAGVRGASYSPIILNNQGGNVGIGTTDPGAYKLYVNGNTNIAGSLNVTGTTTASAFIGPVTGTMSAANVSAGAFGANTGGGNYSFPGNVGAGTANFNAKVSVLMTATDNAGFQSRFATQDFNIMTGRVLVGSWPPSIATTTVTLQSSGASAGDIAFATGNIERMRLSAAGNLGIGTTNPTEKLEVYGTNSAIAFTRSATTGSARFHYKTGASYLWSTGLRANRDDFTIFDEGSSAERLTILKSTGNVGIGTTDPGAYRLKVSGDVAITGTLQTQTGSDFAEEFSVSEELEAGTVVVMDNNGHKSVKPCSTEYDKKVVGIVSDNPSIIAGRVETGKKAVVAMMGVVTVKASSINGSIEKGDLITTSDISGYAMKAESFRPGTIIGKALEDLSGKKGEIKVLVNLQ